MASCKDIKKDINFLANQMLTECFSFMEYSPVNNQENVLDILHDIERAYVQRAIEECGGSKKKAAELLGINTRSIRYRLEKFDIG